jgi:mannose-6-phosphate isomerase-like protein (cupin superfamily)
MRERVQRPHSLGITATVARSSTRPGSATHRWSRGGRVCGTPCRRRQPADVPSGVSTLQRARCPAARPARASLRNSTFRRATGSSSMPLSWLQTRPGHTRRTHRHPAGAYVFVIDGSVIFGLDDREVVVLKAGGSFYEQPGALHSVSRNASHELPASRSRSSCSRTASARPATTVTAVGAAAGTGVTAGAVSGQRAASSPAGLAAANDLTVPVRQRPAHGRRAPAREARCHSRVEWALVRRASDCCRRRRSGLDLHARSSSPWSGVASGRAVATTAAL